MRFLLSALLRRSEIQSVAVGSSFRRSYCQKIQSSSFGIAFDIDGVLLRGSSPIGGALQGLRRLFGSDGSLRIPFLFLTNGECF
ncbi:hypothetical protein ZOSMA_55G00600 [Zostera marina]|uniref:Uncharacterized protein n=1 Tax=Zostera marina TaxID=29655 RepID=A0A0K9NWH2_ZOSMR|nr:hypothetical protein ZOSMA_55G00600 [Zostera marina]